MFPPLGSATMSYSVSECQLKSTAHFNLLSVHSNACALRCLHVYGRLSFTQYASASFTLHFSPILSHVLLDA